MQKILIVIDMQNDFVTGPLGSEAAQVAAKNIAVKATYAEDANGKPIMIYKQPKALSWKKSQKGCCRVALDGQSYEDELTWADHLGEDNLLQPVFRDGNMIKEDTLHDIRARLYKEGF